VLTSTNMAAATRPDRRTASVKESYVTMVLHHTECTVKDCTRNDVYSIISTLYIPHHVGMCGGSYYSRLCI